MCLAIDTLPENANQISNLLHLGAHRSANYDIHSANLKYPQPYRRPPGGTGTGVEPAVVHHRLIY